MNELQRQYGSYPGAVNVAAIDAAPRVIQTAFVRRDEPRHWAWLRLGFYSRTTREQRRQAAALSLQLVRAYLGPDWQAALHR